MSDTERIEIRISPELLAAIDRERGLVPRAAWIKDRLTRSGHHVAMEALRKARPILRDADGADRFGAWEALDAVDSVLRAAGIKPYVLKDEYADEGHAITSAFEAEAE